MLVLLTVGLGVNGKDVSQVQNTVSNSGQTQAEEVISTVLI